MGALQRKLHFDHALCLDICRGDPDRVRIVNAVWKAAKVTAARLLLLLRVTCYSSRRHRIVLLTHSRRSAEVLQVKVITPTLIIIR